MGALWVIWVFYVLGFAADVLYVQPYRRRRASEAGRAYEPGAISFGLRTALPIFTIVLLVRSFVFDAYRIPTPSMEPSLPLGETIWVNRLAYGIRSPLTGDVLIAASEPAPGHVIVFHFPREPRTTYVKRVLGVPGDHIRIIGERIERNGELLFDPQSSPAAVADPNRYRVRIGEHVFSLLDDPHRTASTDLEIQIPEGHYFALGDNLDHSQDSRSWGLVSSRHLIGRVSL